MRTEPTTAQKGQSTAEAFSSGRTSPTVDVLIPTHQPGQIFSELLKRLSAQSLRPSHVRVINTDEQYWDPQFEQDYPGLIVRHIKKEEFDHGGTRHALALESTADLLLFMTQDALPADHHLTAYLAEAFAQNAPVEEPPGSVRVAAAYARQMPRLDCATLEKYTRVFNYPGQGRVKTREDLETLGIKTFFCSNVCAMYDRNIYLEQGGFPKNTIFNEDMIFARGLIDSGYGIAYQAKARVIHSHNYSGRQQFHRNFDLAVSQASHPEVFGDVPSEGEGLRMIRRVALRLFKAGQPGLVFPLLWQSACKYAGYSLGKRYRVLPRWLIRRCTLNQDYWNEKTLS
ncbi:MAG: glycosyltransferase [Eubacterium sp.]|nr:glycosyltransferase [Eubacterium sp.]